jgi:hypothetical protein
VKIARSLLFLAVLAGLAAVAEPARAAHVHVRPAVHVYWGPGWAWYDPWWYYGPHWGGYPVVYPNAAYGSYGALDTDLSPERAEVWVDGKKVGLADDFDGFPNFLWLEKGTYDVAFYLPGHVTLARQYTIYPGMVIDVEDRLEPGEATHPLDLAPKTHERRDARLRDDEDRREYWERQQGLVPGEEPEAEEGEPAEGTVEAPSRGESLDARAEPGRLALDVQPDDASVYLDGRFLGTGRELAGLRSGLIVDPGTHTIEVVRPGREAATRYVQIVSGRETRIEVSLEGE